MRNALLAVACGLLVLVSGSNAAPPADSKVNDEGFIVDWLMLGPISVAEGSGAEAIDLKQVPEEAALQPKAGEKQKVGDKELTWKAVQAKEKQYYIDLAVAGGGATEDVAAYLVAYVFADDEMKDVTAVMSSNDQGKLYLNGKEVIKFTETRVIDKDGDKKAGLTLNKGRNTVVLKVINEKNDWAGAVHFLNKDGKAITGLTVKTAP